MTRTAALILVPALMAGALFFVSSFRIRSWLLVLTAALNAVLAFSLCFVAPAPLMKGWLGVDGVSMMFLCLTSLVFLAAASQTNRYLVRQLRDGGKAHSDKSEKVFVACMMLFLAAMNLVLCSRHLGLFWVGMEATTLASAPLIYYHKNARSLEATWKYILLCSVGIGFALLGNLVLKASIPRDLSGAQIQLSLDDLLANAKSLNAGWLKTSFLLFLVGYGTKMGLAPMHSWLPDAHSEAPSPVSAILSGALLNCAFLGILRVFQVCSAAGFAVYCQEILAFFGMFSIAMAALFLVGQSDYKRMLAYSSVEHMGIMALGVGIGGSAVFGAFFHAINHSLTKTALFLTAGNFLARYRVRSIHKVSGGFSLLPVSSTLWVIGLLAITGAPPFGLFISEFIIARQAVASGEYFMAGLFLVLLIVIFAAMARAVLAMTFGKPPATFAENTPAKPESPGLFLPSVFVLGLTLILGLYVPPGLTRALKSIAMNFGML